MKSKKPIPLHDRVRDIIESARSVDGNEGLTVNDVTPDWIRARGFWSDGMADGWSNNGFNWGNMWPLYG